MPAIGQELQDSFNVVRVQTGLTGNALLDLQMQLGEVGRNTPQKLEDIGASIGVLNQRFGSLTDGQLKETTQAFADLSTITGTSMKTNVDNLGGAMLIFNTKPAEMTKRMDEALRATQAAGVSLSDIIPTLNSVGAAAQGVGMDYEESLGFVAAFAKVGLDASQAQLALGKVAKLASKDGLTASQEWDKLNKVWRDAKDPQEAFSLGAQTLGTRAARMAVLVQNGTLSFGDLTKAIKDGSDTITQATEDTDNLAREWETTKNALKLDLTGPATDMTKGLMDVLKQLRPVLDSFVQTIGAAIGPSISKIAEIMGPAIIGVFQGLSPIIKSFAELLGTVFTSMGPIIDVFIAALQTAAPVIASFIDDIANVLSPVLVALGPIFQDLLIAFSPVMAALGGVFLTTLQALAPAFLDVANAITPIAGDLGKQLADVINRLAPLLPELVRAAVPLALAFVDVVGSGILPLLIDLIPPLVIVIDKFALFTAALLSNKDVLMPLVVTVGLLWAAWEGFAILSSASKAMADFSLATEASLKRMQAGFGTTISKATADTTTLQGSTRVLSNALDEIVAHLETLIGQFKILIATMGEVEGASTVLDEALASVGLTLGTLDGEIATTDAALGGLVLSEEALVVESGILTGALVALATNPIFWIAGLAAALYLAYEKFDLFREGVDTVGRSISDFAEAITKNRLLELLAAVAAGLGAIVLLKGPVMAAFAAMTEGATLLGAAMTGGLSVAISLGIMAIGKFSKAADDAQKQVHDAMDFGNFDQSVKTLDDLGAQVNSLGDKWQHMSAIEKMTSGDTYTRWQSALNQLKEEEKHVEANRAAIIQLGKDIGVTGDAAKAMGDYMNFDWSSLSPSVYEPIFEKLKLGFLSPEEAAGKLKDAIEGTGKVIAKSAESDIDKYTAALDSLQKKQNSMIDPVFAAMDAESALSDAKTEAKKAQDAVNAAKGKDPALNAAAMKATEGVIKAVKNHDEALRTLNLAIKNNPALVQEMDKYLADAAIQGGLTGDQMNVLKGHIQDAAAQAIAMGPAIQTEMDTMATYANNVLIMQDKFARDMIDQSKRQQAELKSLSYSGFGGNDSVAGPMSEALAAAVYDVGSHFSFGGRDPNDPNKNLFIPDGGGDYWLHDNGHIWNHALGGIVEGLSGIDRVPAMVSAGEGILSREAMGRIDADQFNALNHGMATIAPLSPGGDHRGRGETINFYITVKASGSMSEKEAAKIGDTIGSAAHQRLKTRSRIRAS